MKAKLSLIFIPLLLLILLPLAQAPAQYDDEMPLTATLRSILATATEWQKTIGPILTASAAPTSTPYPLPDNGWTYPEPEINKTGALEHKSCIIVPWLTLDGWKKKEFCYPNR